MKEYLIKIALDFAINYLRGWIGDIVGKIKDLQENKTLHNVEKIQDLYQYAINIDKFKNFIDKYGLNDKKIMIILNYIVLVTKKPPYNPGTVWNDDDHEVSFRFQKLLFKKIKRLF